MIRPERADDPREVRTIGEVVAAAFGSREEADLVATIRASGHCVAQASQVSTVGGRIAGHVMVSRVHVDDGEVRRWVCTLSPLAVAPPYQRQGIGSALVRAAVAACDRLGEPLVVLEGSPQFYGRFGFEPAASHGIVMHVPDWAPPEAAQVYRLSTYDPSIRGVVDYPWSPLIRSRISSP